MTSTDFPSLLALLLDVAGIAFLDLPDDAAEGAAPLAEYAQPGSGIQVCLCGSTMPPYAAKAMNRTAYGIYLGAPDICDLSDVVTTLYQDNGPDQVYWHIAFTCGTYHDVTFSRFVHSIAQWSPPGRYARMQHFEQLRVNVGTKPMDFNWFPFTMLDVPTGSGALDDWAIMGHRVSQLLSACTDDNTLPDLIDEAKPGDVVGAIYFIGRLGLAEAWDRVDGDAKQLLSSTLALHLPKASLPSGVVLEQLVCMAGPSKPPFPTPAMREAAHQAFSEWVDIGGQAFVLSIDSNKLVAAGSTDAIGGCPVDSEDMLANGKTCPVTGSNPMETADTEIANADETRPDTADAVETMDMENLTSGF